jgi:bifunctional ADP-heptose synthase (sugar kinase/adenylyltransferase)
MTPARFAEITDRYASLRLALVGDFCLDRYLEIDPARAETSIETGLPVHNVVRVRSQPGAAGTILNNLCALGVGTIWPVGFCGDDGEGFELHRALAAMPGVRLDHFHRTSLRRTFTYCKPLLMHPGQPPQELNRLDSKNWEPTPALLAGEIWNSINGLRLKVDGVAVMDQVDIPDTGVVTSRILPLLGEFPKGDPGTPVIADCRRGLRGYPPVTFKMNEVELTSLLKISGPLSLQDALRGASSIADWGKREVFVTLAERGILGAAPNGEVEHVPCHPLRGPIDIVGAGDSVTANLTAALAAGATLREAIELANAAASIVVHQLGTTGTASVPQIRELLLP